jgi:hypothetical protein
VTRMNVIHIGLPKTASTTLQNRLLGTNRNFIYVGRINNGYADDETKELIERITFQDSLEYDAGATAKLLQSRRAKAAAADCPMLVSAESLSVGGRADRRLIAERLNQLFAPAKILIVVRAQPAMLQSLYLHHLRASRERFVTFEEWLDQTYGGIRFTDVHRVELNYDRLVRAYEEIFGSDNVLVVPFEQIKDKDSACFRVLAGLLNTPFAEVQACFTANVDNQRMSNRHLLTLHIQSRLPSGTNLAELGQGLLPQAVYEWTRRLVTGGRRVPSPELPERWQKRVAAACAQGNVRLATSKNIPLAALSYPFAMERGRTS